MPFEVRTIGPGPAGADAWSYYHVPGPEKAGIVCGFMTRTSDAILHDAKGRAAFMAAFSAKEMIILDQEHGDTVHIITAGERPRAGDGLVLVEPGVIGVIKTADCLPVILYAPGYPACAIVHAGWRGTALLISRKAVAAMVGLGIATASMRALIGPGIGPCCYNVGEDVVAAFKAAGISDEVFARRGDLTFLDLKEANRRILTAEGVHDIDDANLCTSCRKDLFFSARRGRQRGRQINFALIKG
jgi:YfiH family protein